MVGEGVVSHKPRIRCLKKGKNVLWSQAVETIDTHSLRFLDDKRVNIK